MSDLDAFMFEVLRHRLWSYTLEGATALQRVSGSPLATEAFDMNTSIMSAAGEVAFVGPYLLTGPMGQGLIVRGILDGKADDPRVEPGDVYLCNDPYSGSAHQNCVTLVAPIHDADRLIAWSGATLHVVDVGGTHVGQIGFGARSILDEAPPIPPTKLVRRGAMIEDVESAYIGRSRTPELNALDLRAKLAAVNTIRARIDELVAEHGPAVVGETIEHVIEQGAQHLRRRLRELPDGVFAHSAFLDRSDEGGNSLYEVKLRIEKREDRVLFDFRGSSPQAGAVVNCTRSGLWSGVLIAVLTTLVWDAPWCPAAIERAVDVRSDPGSVVDASWPAGCSMATMAAGFAVTTATQVALGELLARSATDGDRAMAAWAGAVGSVDVFGVDAAGRPFGTVLLDSMACGTGATGRADGIDCGGFLRSIGCVVANIEQYEARFPLLYLWRRQEGDTGGPGRYRGGTGVGYAVMAHGVERIENVSPHFSGTLEPESVGLQGGHPGALNRVLLHESTGVADAFENGRVPGNERELAGTSRLLPGVARLGLGRGDVLEVRTSGGGGWGDAIERDPERVAIDVRASLVGRKAATERYGVVIGDDGAVADDGTRLRRTAIRDGRAMVAGTARPTSSPDDHPHVPDGSGQSADRLPSATIPLAPAADPAVPRFALRERYCPRCLRLVTVERIKLEEDPTP